MTGPATRLRTYRALGLKNLLRVAAYRGRLRLGCFPAQPRNSADVSGPLFAPVSASPVSAPIPQAWRSSGLVFSYREVPLHSDMPNWLSDPLTGAAFPDANPPWFKIGDFEDFGDIKLVWEYSRFGWLLPMAARARNGETKELDRLNAWLADWCASNPAWRGPNWKCGQEASIRVMMLAMAAQVLGQARTPTDALLNSVAVHLSRIAPTISYARAQDNNHGTSEAAGLFIGGSWLAKHGRPEGARWAEIGRRVLEERVDRLIAEDGSFSQHSTTYHRMLLDTLSMVEIWRRELDLPGFSRQFHVRVATASEWLRNLILGSDGDAPNLGLNDGAQLFLLGGRYRDFRPSCQLATMLFVGRRAFAEDGADVLLQWFQIPIAEEIAPKPVSRRFDDGGYAILRDPGVAAFIRYPRFRFRPGQADAMHLDLWLDGVAWLRDGGTYSYNSGWHWIDYLGGIAGHNSVQFDDAEQMPRLGRFLLGDWLAADFVEGPVADPDGQQHFTARYRSRQGWTHSRAMLLRPGRLVVRDDVSGFRNKAILRWRLARRDWTLEGAAASADGVRIHISASHPVAVEMQTGYESLHYHEVSEVPVLTAELHASGHFETIIEWPV